MSKYLNHSELKYLLIDSLKLYTEDSIYISGSNPYQFNINKKTFYIFISNVHDSGSGRPNDDELRIQFAESDKFLAAKQSGIPVLFIGYYVEENVFTAWDPFIQTARINTRKTLSIYTRKSTQKKAKEKGL